MQLDQRKPETSWEAPSQVMVGWRNGKDELVEVRNPRIVMGLILVAQFKSFLMPLLILLAIPPGIAGVRVHPATPRRRHVPEGSRANRMPRAAASNPHDLACDRIRADTQGVETWHRQGGLRPAWKRRRWRKSRNGLSKR